IPAQAGIQCVEFQLFRINFETLIPSFPRKWESGFFEFQSFPINCLSIECLDSRLRGNDAFHLPPPPEKRKKMPSEDLSDGICGKTGRAGGSEEDFAPA
ncbi:hypothetical protein ACE3A4_001911, partial [Neisseria gonorrhoeae]